MDKITQAEFDEYLKIKKQLELVNKVESKIYEISYELESDEGFDPEYEYTGYCSI